MRGVSASAGAGREKRVAEEGQRAQLVENPHRVFRLPDLIIRDLYGRYGHFA